MPDHQTITDRGHLARITQQLLADILDLQDAWLAEDSAACYPGTCDGGPRGTEAPDPTRNLAMRDNRYRDRDHIGTELLHTARRIRTLKQRHQPRPAGGPCRCCHTETATHGLTDDHAPAICWPCWRYLKANGAPCDEKVHQARPTVRWCECPPECCDPCPDHAAEGRRLSDRCRQRKTRGLWATREDHAR